MKKSNVRKGIVFGMAVTMAMAVLAGCGEGSNQVQESTAEASVTQEAASAPYFSKGVYANYAKEAENPPKTYFYVFSDDSYGYTADGENDDLGLPFDTEQTDGKVVFTMGGVDGDKDVLIITGAENGTVYGYFEDVPERELVFEPVADADPEGFSAVNYLSAAAGEDLVYNDANGWSVKYDPSCITVNGGGPVTTFVYTGDCPGTCMITATYDVDMDAKAKAEDLAKSYSDTATVTEALFPGTEDVNGYYVDAFPGQTGPGFYQSAYVRDYMDGYLVFEFTDHVAGDDAIDMPVSDALAAIIDSLTFG